MNFELAISDLPELMDQFFSFFPSTPIYSFLESLSNSGPMGQIATVPIIMLLTALVVALPALVVMGIAFLVKKFTKSL